MHEKRKSLITSWYAAWGAVLVEICGGSVPFGMTTWEELALLTSSVAASSADERVLYLRLLYASGVLAILLAPASDASVSSSQLVVGIGQHQLVRAPAPVLHQK